MAEVHRNRTTIENAGKPQIRLKAAQNPAQLDWTCPV